VSGEQRYPFRLDNPVDNPLGVRDAKRRDGRKSMKNVAHCAEAHNEQPELGLRRQTLIFS
jgi:hypothetical protein